MKRRWSVPLALICGVVGLFVCYLRIARAVGTNADGAGNALQGWDLIHGNLALHHWTLSDVAFYPLELLEYGLIELFTGLHPSALTAGAALTYLLVVVLVAVLAYGKAGGRAGWARLALALSIVAVPAPGLGHAILLNQPDHIGSAIPLLLAWLALDRAPPRWLPWLVGAALTLGQLADPLVTLIGALPLVVVGALRLALFRRRADGVLALAGAASAVVAYLLTWLIESDGGYAKHAVPSGVTLNNLGHHLALARDSLAVLFAFHFTELHGWVDNVLAVVHLAGVALVVLALVVVFARSLRGPVLNEVIALGIVINLVAFVLSTLNSDLLAAREIAPVLPLSAVLAARVLLVDGRRLPARLPSVALAAVVTALLLTTLAGQLSVGSTEPSGTAVAKWLASRHLTYGLASYWTANTITLDSGDAVRAVPVTGSHPILGYRWESRSDWYDPARHDARFIVIDLHNTHFGTVAAALAQFGAPVEQVRLLTSAGRYAQVLVYDHNLLVGLGAWCSPGHSAPSMADC